MRSVHYLLAYAAAAILVTWTAACGAGSSSVVARVGEATITQTTLDHWTRVLTAGGKGSSAGERHEMRKQVLDFLIASHWTINEAAARGLTVSQQEIHQQLNVAQSEAFPAGETEAHEFLKETGETPADLEFEARADLAASKLRELVVKRATAVTRRQVEDYYGRHSQNFAVPELRRAEITNRKTKAAGEQVRRAVEAGANIATGLQRKVGEQWITVTSLPGQHNWIETAIYAAKPHVLVGPVKLHADYFVFRIDRVIPAMRRTLAQVEGSIRKRLVDEARHSALAVFVAEWSSKWRARTDCRPGYVVQKCRQYVGATTPEANLVLG